MKRIMKLDQCSVAASKIIVPCSKPGEKIVEKFKKKYPKAYEVLGR